LRYMNNQDNQDNTETNITLRTARFRPALWLTTLLTGVGLGACVMRGGEAQPRLLPSNTVSGFLAAPDPFTPAAVAAPAYLATGEPIVKAVRQAGPAVVSIDTSAKVGFRVFDDPFDQFRGRRGRYEEREVPTGAGSGVLLDGGYVLTNQHVVGEAVQSNGRIIIRLSDGRQLTATAVGTDQATDIALLKVQGDKLPVAPLGTDDPLLPGQTVIAIGNPVGLSASVSAGVVSALNRPVEMEDRVYEDLIQTDAPINPGNSGGALVDLGGRVVGINTLVRADAQNIGFAIPIRTALRVTDELKRFGKIRRPATGFIPVEMNARIARRLELPEDTKGVVIARIGAKTPADSAGLQVGDVVTALAGQTVTDMTSYRRALTSRKIGEEVMLTILRGANKGTVRLRLGEAE
jgi:S1-C subfamily serine protease